jgi:DNA-directed RNA polymerase specialized sigma24 family protein
MHDARDAEDTRLLETGDHKTLLAGYFHPVRQRCLFRLRDADAADEVTQAIFLRLATELARGRAYSVPFRVVVWKITGWTINEHWAGAPLTVPLPEGWDPAAPGDDFADWVGNESLTTLLAGLPERQRQVCEQRYLEGRDPEQIADALGMKRNAVDQALHNAHAKLREALLGAS